MNIGCAVELSLMLNAKVPLCVERARKKAGDPMAKAMDLTIWQSAKTDPQGSYTGTPADPYEVPVQDADDL